MGGILIQHILVSALLALAVGLSCAVLRPRPAVAHALWAIVLIKLLVPPAVSWPWSTDEVMGMLQMQRAASEMQAVPQLSPVSRDTSLPARLLRLRGAAEQASPNATTIGPAIPWKNAVIAGLLCVWALGSIFTATVQAVRLVRLRRIVRKGHPAPAWLIEQTRELAERFEVKPPEVLLVPDLSSALSMRLIHSRILIPDQMIDLFGPEHWREVIAHEMAHLKRRDPWMGLLVLLSGCIWWWNPVAWYARRRIHTLAEMACDAWVVWALPEHRRDYANTLVRIVELASTRPSPMLAMGIGSGPAVAFERRLVMILKHNVPRQIPLVAFLAMAALTALVLPGWSQETPPAPEATPAPEPQAQPAPEATPPEPAEPAAKSDIEKTLDSPVSIEFENIHVNEVLEFLSDAYGINIVLDWRVVALPPIRPPAPGAPGQPATAPPPDGAVPTLPATATSRSPWQPERYVTDGMVDNINVTDIPIRQALEAVLRPLNLTFVVEPSLVWISSPAMIEADAARPKPPAQSEDKTVMEALASSVSIEFEDVYIGDILEFISDSWNVNIVLDKRVVAPLKPATTDRKLGSPGFVTDGYVKSININNVSMREALGIILRMLDLTFMPDNGFIWVSSPELIMQPPLSSEAVQPASEEKTSELNPKPTPAPSTAASTTSGETAETEVALRDIKKVGDKFRAQIQTKNTAKWYDEGESFEAYTLLKIDPGKKTVDIRLESSREALTLPVTPAPSGGMMFQSPGPAI